MEKVSENLQLDETGIELKNKLILFFEKFESKEKIKCVEALNLAISLHLDQHARTDGPYVNHILRVATRIAEYFEIIDLEILIGAMLHDSVEDQARKISALFAKGGSEQENALEYIKYQFGDRVSIIVSGVTNDETEEEVLEEAEENKRYVEHVVKMIKNPDVFYVKLSDFFDNGMNIDNTIDKELQHERAQKYYPLFQIFIDRIQEGDINMSQEKKAEIINRLSSVKKFVESIL